MMILGPSTSHKLTITTGIGGAAIKIKGSYADKTGTGPTSYSFAAAPFQVASITTATTTDVLAGETSTERSVRELSILNDHATVSETVTVNYTDGSTTTPLTKAVSLAPGESLKLNAAGDLVHYDANMGAYAGVPTTPEIRMAYTTSDQTAIGTSFANVTGLSFSVEANKNYLFEFYIFADSDATTTGIDVAVDGPASPTAIEYEQFYYTSATAIAVARATAYNNNTGSTASAGTSARYYRVTGILRNGANAGTLSARIKRENVGSGPNVRSGSWGRCTRLAA